MIPSTHRRFEPATFNDSRSLRGVVVGDGLSFRIRSPFVLLNLLLLFLLSLADESSATRIWASAMTATPSDPSFIDSGARWQDDTFCPANTFVRGFKSWQDDTTGDHKGLTQIFFDCQRLNRRHRRAGARTWITSGVGVGKPTTARHCRHHVSVVVGVRVIFGGPSVGAVVVKPICDNPATSTTSASATPTKHTLVHNIPAFAPTHNPGRLNSDWQQTDELLCGSGEAVCGLNKSVDGTDGLLDGIITDESGINEIKIFCCAVS